MYEGPNGDYPAVLESPAGVKAEQAVWKPSPSRNSIWQIVEHLTASALWQLEVLEKGHAAPPVWTEPTGSENQWQESLKRLGEAHARLTAALEKLSDGDLLVIPAPEEKQILLVLLLSSAAHEAHHCGQIDYLKGLQAALSGGAS